jgi:hypothetical protein
MKPDSAHELPTDDQPWVNGIGTPATYLQTSPTQEQVYQFLDHVQKTSSVNMVTTPSSPAPELVPTFPPALTPPDNLISNPVCGLLTNDQQYITTCASFSPSQEHIPTSPLTSPDKVLTDHVQESSTNDSPQCVNTSPPPSQGHIPASPPAPPSPDKPLSDYVQESSKSTDHKQCINITGTSSTRGHVPTPQTPLLRVLKPPDKLHPKLSCWIKNIKRLSSLIDRLEVLASSAPAEHQPQLLKQVEAFRTVSKEQKERFMKFLQLSEEYANKYLLDISDEIQRQSSFLGKLEERLDAAKKLREEAANLQMLYESGTVSTMKDLRATGKPAPSRL